MPGLVPGIHALLLVQAVDGRDKPGHDVDRMRYAASMPSACM